MPKAELNLPVRIGEADTPTDQYVGLYARETTKFPNGEFFFKGDDGIEHSLVGPPGPPLVVNEITELHTTTPLEDVISATGTYTVTLHSTVSATKIMIIKSILGTITIDADGAETIDGMLTVTLTTAQSVTLVPVVAGWIIA